MHSFADEIDPNDPLEQDFPFGYVHRGFVPLAIACEFSPSEEGLLYGGEFGNIGSPNTLMFNSTAPGGTWRQFDAGEDPRRSFNYAIYEGVGPFVGAYIDTTKELGDTHIFNGTCSISPTAGKYVDMIFDFNPATGVGRELRFHSNGDLEIVGLTTLTGLFTPSAGNTAPQAAHPSVCIVYQRSTGRFSLSAGQEYGDGSVIFPMAKVTDMKFPNLIDDGNSYAFRVSETTGDDHVSHHIDSMFYRDYSNDLADLLSSAKALWEVSDLSTVWQDAAGTIPAGDGDPVGRLDDKSGNGWHFTSTGAARPTLVQDGAQWYLKSAAGQSMSVASSTAAFKFMHNGEGSSLCCAARYGETADINAILPLLGNNGGATANVGFYHAYEDRVSISANNRLAHNVVKGGGFAFRIGDNNTLLPDTNQAAFIRYKKVDGVDAVGFVNGAQVVTAEQSSPPSAANATHDLELFGFGASPSGEKVRFYGASMHDFAMTDTERDLITEHIADLAGIVL